MVYPSASILKNLSNPFFSRLVGKFQTVKKAPFSYINFPAQYNIVLNI